MPPSECTLGISGQYSLQLLLDRFNDNAARLAIASITLAEPMHGAGKSAQDQRGLTWLSNNLREFERVEGPLFENWL